MNGKVKEYDDNGLVIFRGNYVNGKKVEESIEKDLELVKGYKDRNSGNERNNIFTNNNNQYGLFGANNNQGNYLFGNNNNP